MRCRFTSCLAIALACLCQAAKPAEGKKPREKCASGLKGDFGYRTCAAFCKEDMKANHCKMCKCQSCTFCGGTTQPKTTPRATDGATRSQNADGTGRSHNADGTGRPHGGGKKQQQQQQAPAVTIAASTPVDPAEPVAPTTQPTVVPATPTKQQHLMLGGALALAAAAALYAFARPKPAASSEAAAWELECPADGQFHSPPPPPPSGLLTAEARVRTLCVAFLCMQYVLHGRWPLMTTDGH